MFIKKIISGGQTGADIAGLETAKECGIATGGFVPKGCKTERGPDHGLLVFGVKEISEESYSERTIKNVMNSDGTVIFSKVNLSEKIEGNGTILTYQTAIENP